MKIGNTKTAIDPSICQYAMNHDPPPDNSDAYRRLGEACLSEKPRLRARLRAVGRSLEEAGDNLREIIAGAGLNPLDCKETL